MGRTERRSPSDSYEPESHASAQLQRLRRLIKAKGKRRGVGTSSNFKGNNLMIWMVASREGGDMRMPEDAVGMAETVIQEVRNE